MGTIGIQELVMIMLVMGIPALLLAGLVIAIIRAKRAQLKRLRREP